MSKNVSWSTSNRMSLLSEFLNQWGMNIAPSISVMLPCTKKYLRGIELKIPGQTLEHVLHHRFLEVVLDQSLPWIKRIDLQDAKVNKTINMLRYFTGVHWRDSIKFIIMLHSALVLQIITYSLPALHRLSATQESRLHYMIARSHRICLDVPRPTCGTLVWAETRQLPLQTLREHDSLRHF